MRLRRRLIVSAIALTGLVAPAGLVHAAGAAGSALAPVDLAHPGAMLYWVYRDDMQPAADT